jgi:hypothetical protein
MSVLTDRVSLANAFYRLTGTSANNPGLVEHDSTTLETLYQFLQYGAWDAQAWLIDGGLADRWVTSYTLTSWTGSDSSDGGRYQSLPSDFLRLAGDDYRSAIRNAATGLTWGTQVNFADRWNHSGNIYWLQDENLWIGRRANTTGAVTLDYHHKLATLADGTTVDFPEEHRSLIVAYAADRAMTDSWLPGDMEMQAKITANLKKLQREAYRRIRRSSAPRKMRTTRSGATHWMT